MIDKIRANKKVIIGATLMFLIVLVAGVYFYYQVIYRGENELPTDAIQTNRDAAVYSLNELVWSLSKEKNISKYVFNGDGEDEYGTYIVPGLKATETLEFSWEETPVICTSMTPQGLVATEEYILISAYCRASKHNSVIYVLDKESREFIKKIVLKGKPHVGGLAYDSKNKRIWMSGKFNGVAQANAFTLENLEKYQFALEHRPIKYNATYDLYSIERSSFMTYHDQSLYVGCYESGKMSVVERYEINDKGGLTVKAHPDAGFDKPVAQPVETAVISGRVQGMAFHNNRVLLSQSSGIRKSNLLLFKHSSEMVPFTNEDSVLHITLPPQLEQVYADGDELYMLFESAAYAYRGYVPTKIDRVVKFDMEKFLSKEY